MDLWKGVTIMAKTKLYVVDAQEWCGSLLLNDAPDNSGEIDFEVDIWDAFDQDADEWDDEKVRSSAEKQVRDAFGDTATIIWE